jgi:hypothetical protein
MIKDYYPQRVEPVSQLPSVPGRQHGVLKHEILPGHRPPADWIITNPILYLVVVKVVHPRTSVDGNNALHQVAIAWLRDLHPWGTCMNVAGFRRGLGHAVGLSPGAVLWRVGLKVLCVDDIVRTELAGAPAADRAQRYVDMDVAGLGRRCASDKKLASRRWASLRVQLA